MIDPTKYKLDARASVSAISIFQRFARPPSPGIHSLARRDYRETPTSKAVGEDLHAETAASAETYKMPDEGSAETLGEFRYVNMVNGNMVNGNMVNGNMVNGNMVNGNMVNGNMANGNMANGNMAIWLMANG